MGRQRDGEDRFHVQLYREKIGSHIQRNWKPVDYVPGIVYTPGPTHLYELYENGFYRWRIAWGRLWATAACGDFALPALVIDDDDVVAPVVGPTEGFIRRDRLWFLGDFWCDPGWLDGPHFPLSGSPFMWESYFDFLPTSKKDMLFFRLIKGEMSIWEGQRKIPNNTPKARNLELREAGNGDVKWSELKKARIKAPFVVPFVVYGSGTTFFFVTQSGKLYISKKPAKEPRKIESLWIDPKRPIGAVISDTASNKTFAFAEPAKKDDKQAQSVYFELAEKIQTHPYDRKGLKPAKGDNPLKIVMEYIRVLQSDKMLK